MNEKDTRLKPGKSILEYFLDYYEEYETYSRSPNRKSHIPYIFKALIIDDPEKIIMTDRKPILINLLPIKMSGAKHVLTLVSS